MEQDKLLRPIQKKFRLTKEENELLKQRMKKYNFSNLNTYARQMLLNGKVVMVDYSELTNLRIEINRIGTNINQLTKYIHTNEEISLEQFQQLRKQLSEIKSKMEQYLYIQESLFEKKEKDD